MNTKKWIFTILAALLLTALYVYPNSISLTAPLWDYCGLHQTHAGQALDCIAFDVDVFTLK